jgi:8-oxo-dGTP pyrophosphatase MutT (NUDIX family)
VSGDGRWTVRERRPIYQSPWVSLELDLVELPDGSRLEHHVVRVTPSAGVLLVDPERRVLLLRRHRFITQHWSWELPMGRLEASEDVESGAARELLEETGWRAGRLESLVDFDAIPGLSDHHLYILAGTLPERVAEPTDPHEAVELAWFDTAQLRDLLVEGTIPDGPSLIGLLYALTFGPLADR